MAGAGSFLPLLKDQIAALDGFNDAAFRLGDHYALVMARGETSEDGTEFKRPLPRIIIADKDFRPVEDFPYAPSTPNNYDDVILVAVLAAINAEVRGHGFDALNAKLDEITREKPLQNASAEEIRSGFRAAGFAWAAETTAQSSTPEVRAVASAASQQAAYDKLFPKANANGNHAKNEKKQAKGQTLGL